MHSLCHSFRNGCFKNGMQDYVCIYVTISLYILKIWWRMPSSAFCLHCRHRDHLCTTAHRTSVRSRALFHFLKIMIFDRTQHWVNARTNEWMFSDEPSVSVELIIQDWILVEIGRFLDEGLAFRKNKKCTTFIFSCLRRKICTFARYCVWGIQCEMLANI